MVTYDKSFASNYKSKYWSKKNECLPKYVYKSTSKKYIFDCICGHEFTAALNHISNGKWCSFCSNPPKQLCEDNNCNECYEKSFASHPKSEFWSDKNQLKPRQVFKNSHKSFLFDCNKCYHELNIKLEKISIKNSWCSYCVNQKLCEKEECNECYEKSFASHIKSKFWSNKNDLIPRQIFKQSNKKYIFDCTICNHEFECNIDSIYKGVWCIFCANQKLCENNDCTKCFNKSFALHHKSKFWSDKNKLQPKDLFRSTNKKFWFNCDICKNEFYSALNHISNGEWCPHCKHKTELKLFEWLKEKYPNVQKQLTFYWSQKKRYDFVINNIIIELDGPQHFKQVSNWQTPEENQINDSLKNKLANDNGYRMIRICQEIVLNDLEDWDYQLINAIKNNETIIRIGNIYD